MRIKLDGIHLDKTKLGSPAIGNPYHAPLYMDVDVMTVDCEYHVSIVFTYTHTPRIRFWESITGWRWKEVAEGVLVDKKTQRISEVEFDMQITAGYGALVQKLHGIAYAVKGNIWSVAGNAQMTAKALLQNKTKVADYVWRKVHQGY